MQLSVKWFISLLVENQLLTKETGSQLNGELGGDPDLLTYAQACLDKIAAGLSPEDAQSLLEQMQQVIDYAQTQADSGAVPPGFEEDNATPTASSGDLDAVASQIPRIMTMSEQELGQYLETFLNTLRNFGASDFHISAGAPIFFRKAKKNYRLMPDYPISAEESQRLNFILMNEQQIAQFESNQDMNYALVVGTDRYRVSLMYHKQGIAGCYHIVPSRLQTLAELGFLDHDIPTVEKLLDYNNGLILVTGPLGSGKTTTLASMISIANEKRQDHIISVEDPIEIVIPSKGCQITQRQIGTCTNSYGAALKGALREDPDIIVIGEMHDLETIEKAITAAETGHLVIGTLHTCDAANTMNRMLDVFPPSQQPQIRAMTAGSLRGIVCQKLLPDVNGKLTVVYEILINTLAVANVITEGKIFQLKASMQIGSKAGMCTIDQNIFEKFQRGILSEDVTRENLKDASVIEQFNREVAIAKAKQYAAEKAAAKHKK